MPLFRAFQYLTLTSKLCVIYAERVIPLCFMSLAKLKGVWSRSSPSAYWTIDFLTNISLYTVTEALGKLYGNESWFKSAHLSYAWKVPIFIWSGPNSYMLDTKSYQSCNRLAFWHFISRANIFIMALMACLVSAAGYFIFFSSTVHVKEFEPGQSISFKIACAPSKT